MAVRVAEEVSANKFRLTIFRRWKRKLYRTIELYKAAREAQTVAERDIHRLREQLEEREEEAETLRRQMVQLTPRARGNSRPGGKDAAAH